MGPQALPTNDWTHVGGVYNSTLKTLTLYVDGAWVGEVAAAGVEPVWKGAGPGYTRVGVDFAGGIDDVRIWQVARSEYQIDVAA